MAITETTTGYKVDVRLDGQRRRKTFASYDEAVAYEKDIQKQAQAERKAKHKEAVRQTMSCIFNRVCNAEGSNWLEGSKPRRNAEIVLEQMGWWDKPIENISEADLQKAWQVFRGKGNSESTINRKKSSISVLFTHAMKLGVVPRKPLGLEKGKEGQGRIRFLSPLEEKQMLELWEHIGLPQYSLFCIVLLDTGLRVTEALSLRQGDIMQKSLRVESDVALKKGNSRVIPLTQRAYDALLELFKSKFDGITQGRLNDLWADRLRPMMGLEDDTQFVPHCLRHTCASRLVMGGMDLARVQKWMGHKSIATTLRYVHLAPETLSAGADILTKQSQI